MWLKKRTGYRFFYITLILFIFSSFVSPVASAVSFDELFYSGNDILYYDPRSTICADSTNTVDADGTAVSSDNVKALLEYFTGKGLSLAAASGIAGNIRQESGFNPAIIQGGEIADENVDILSLRFSDGSHKGFGIAQWTDSGRKQGLVNYAKQTNRPITSLAMQLDYIWVEMQASSYDYMVKRLNEIKSDPVAAAAVFHGLTPNIEREGSSINQVFVAARAKFGFERSGDSSNTVIRVRGGNAKTYYQNYQGHIQDGTGVSGVSGATTGDTPVECEDGVSGDDVGIGKGSFTDSGQVAGWASVLHNSQLVNKIFGTSLVAKGWCAAITSKAWRGQNIGYGESYAIHLWEKYGDSKGHKDRSPKLGAILLYRGSNVAGHVVIYLGNNKILNDGNITDANFVEEGGWNQTYLGWIDPNDVGWTTRSASEAQLKSYLTEYLYK